MEVRVAMAQINVVTGDLKGNALRIVKAMERAHQEGADIVVFPERALTGHCAGALLEQRHFIEDQRRYLYEDIAARVPANLAIVVGIVPEQEQGTEPE
ncbi:MAG TPA: NAD+ synthase, partial [Firmicutes bacterium]|nr:NAD+ synthase [Bacillota bacterium]